MKIVCIDRLGDWNPQLLRELKGSLKIAPIMIAAAISFLGQFVLFQYFRGLLPIAKYDYVANKKYCIIDKNICIKDAAGNYLANWNLWFTDIFSCLSLIAIFTLLTLGCYMLIADLAHEERRGTLNFLRQSPESTARLLIGKILGVPILVYLAVALTVPFHLWIGLSANIPLGKILAFYAVVIVCCIFFYSASLLYSLVSGWLGGFQAWLGGAIVLGLLTFNYILLIRVPIDLPLTWLRLLSCFDLIPNLYNSSLRFYGKNDYLHWFYWRLNSSNIILFSFAILHFTIGIYWIWQSLNRCFRNLHATMLNKKQSYFATSLFAISTIGFAYPGYALGSHKDSLMLNLMNLFLLNLLFFLYLIAAISPHRQVLQDWSRYRQEKVSIRKSFWSSSLLRDLIESEKSPALVAIAINLVIAVVPLSLLIGFASADLEYKIIALFALALAASVVIIYAAITQYMLLMKTPNRIFWIAGTMGAMIFLPPLVLSVLSIDPSSTFGFLWLFSVCAPIAALSVSGTTISAMTNVSVLAIYWTILGILSWRLMRQLHVAGESATKKMLNSSKP